MPAPTIYRSTDVNAPALIGGGGSLISLLDACLVNGYGSAFASGTITNDGTNVSDGDTVTIGSQVYTFRTSLAAQPAYSIAIGASNTASMNVLASAINGQGTVGTTFTAGTNPHPDVWANQVTTVVTLTARKGGVAGNSVALARASAHLSVSAATLSGGGGTDSKLGLGWTKPFTGSPAVAQAVYRQGSSGMYLQVDDAGPGSGGPREARCWGWEAMTAWATGTGQFPLPAQTASTAVVFRKSSTLDSQARPWMLIGDNRTFYLLIQEGSAVGNWCGHGFGDFFSFVAGDAYKCMILAKDSENTTTLTASPFGQQQGVANGGNMPSGGHWLPRNFTGLGGSTAFTKGGDGVLSGSSVTNMLGIMAFPNGSDGGLYVAPVRIIDGSTPGGTTSGNLNLRGRLRGFYHAPYPITAFSDGDTFNGSGEYAGRSFLIVKGVHGNNPGVSLVVFETTAWDTST